MNLHAVKNYIYYLVVSLCFIGGMLIPIDTDYANKIVIVVGFISFIMLMCERQGGIGKGTLFFALSLFILGAIDLLWYVSYKTEYVIYKNAYRGYLEAGKMFVLSAFTLIYLSKNARKVSFNFHLIASVLMQTTIYVVSFYQHYGLGANRIPLSAMGGGIDQMGAATIAAYMITFCSLYSSLVFVNITTKYKWFVFYINFLLSFSVIIMTGTRAAIFTYPFIVAIILISQYYKHRLLLAKCIGGMFISLIICGLIFQKYVDHRIVDLQNDIAGYQDTDNSVSSVGARFSMVMAGFKSAPDGMEWQSLEQRATKIIALSKENPIYVGATDFLNVHMHNDVIEALSTKGVLGVATLLLFYVALIAYCISEGRYVLLVFPAAIILFGISDVITHDKPIPASWIICLLLSSLLLKNKEKVES
ncbi:O-antigen ligase family protein [Kluyvera sp. CHPC 1.251]|uniref:O-antigen ligase family protein n=1 Tax=Kluyvera sp. CHPC 1.251 TaxID=2995175 RepID=UPI002FD80065